MHYNPSKMQEYKQKSWDMQTSREAVYSEYKHFSRLWVAGILAFPAIWLATAAGGILRYLDHGPKAIFLKQTKEWSWLLNLN